MKSYQWKLLVLAILTLGAVVPAISKPYWPDEDTQSQLSLTVHNQENPSNGADSGVRVGDSLRMLAKDLKKEHDEAGREIGSYVEFAASLADKIFDQDGGDKVYDRLVETLLGDISNRISPTPRLQGREAQTDFPYATRDRKVFSQEEQFDLVKFVQDFGNALQRFNIFDGGDKPGDILRILGSLLRKVDDSGKDIGNFLDGAGNLVDSALNNQGGGGNSVQQLFSSMLG